LRFPSDENPVHRTLRILIVEDNPADLFLIREAIEAAGLDADVYVASDGEKAMQFLDDAERDALAPSLVILDINLPKKHGIDVLQHLRRGRRSSRAVVIVVSTSDSARDRRDAMNFGANEYFRKPSDYDEFLKLGDRIKELIAGATPASDDDEE